MTDRFMTHRFYLFVSLIMVAFGQPVWDSALGIMASIGGYALFWWCVLDLAPRRRFWTTCSWYAIVQAVQLIWFISHPYNYIYAVIVGLSFALGLQFAFLSKLVTRERINQVSSLLMIAGVFTVGEWARLYFLSGLSFNPSGLAMTGYLYPMQLATIGGIYGLSFWVMITNLVSLRLLIQGYSRALICSLAALVLFPWIFGFIHVEIRSEQQASSNTPALNLLILDTSFPAEETLGLQDVHQYVDIAQQEWHKALQLLKKHQDNKVDLILLPEGFVPFGMRYPFYKFDQVRSIFDQIFGKQAGSKLPPLEPHVAQMVPTAQGPVWMVTNGYWVEAISRLFDAEVVIGLEEVQDDANGKPLGVLNGAIHFDRNGNVNTYGKRILVPMAEYIPFDWCKRLTAKYGVTDSYRSGAGPVLFQCSGVKCGASVCYEETFGNHMRDTRALGAQVLLNVTNDAWYPNSILGQQHYHHARIRTVELGLPLARSCNYGVSAAVDSLGREIGSVDGSNRVAWSGDALAVTLPVFSYRTLYAFWGDLFIISVSLAFVLYEVLQKLVISLMRMRRPSGQGVSPLRG